jgi:hypothetical protein
MTFLFFHKKSLIILINLRAVVTNIVTNTQNGLELKTPTHLSFFFSEVDKRFCIDFCLFIINDPLCFTY